MRASVSNNATSVKTKDNELSGDGVGYKKIDC